MAEHIARNGIEFESTVKAKNVNNPQFAFLYGGDGSEHYQQMLDAHRSRNGQANGGGSQGATAPSPSQFQQGGAMMGSMPSMSFQQPQQPRGPPPQQLLQQHRAPFQNAMASQQRPQSSPVVSKWDVGSNSKWDGGSNSKWDVGSNDCDPELADLVQKWQEPHFMPLMVEAERQLGEIAASLEAMASRDAIRNARAWIESNSGMAQQIAGNIMKRLPFLKSCSHRLHILYLVHDVLQTEAARKDSVQPIIRGFKPFLVWILRPCFQLASSSGEQESGKVLRLLQLWVERSIITSSESEEMRKLITAPQIPGSHGNIPQQSAQQLNVPPRPPTPLRPNVAQQYGGGVQMATGVRPMGVGPQAGVQRPYGMQQGGMQQGGWQTPAAMMQGQRPFGRPTLPGYKPEMLQPGKQTPETIPVGLMATMLRLTLRREREARKEFVPYKPIETQYTPQMLPQGEMPTPRLMERIQDFYEDLRDDDRSSRSSSRSRSRSISTRSHSRSRSFQRLRPRSRSRDGPTGFGVAVPPPVLD